MPMLFSPTPHVLWRLNSFGSFAMLTAIRLAPSYALFVGPGERWFSRPIRPAYESVLARTSAAREASKAKPSVFNMADGFALLALPAGRGNGEDSRCAG